MPAIQNVHESKPFQISSGIQALVLGFETLGKVVPS